MKKLLLLLIASVATVSSCDERTPGALASSGAPPAMFTAVGPVPGPTEHPARPANPYVGDRSAMAEGRQLFVQFNCVGCHGGRAGGGMGPSLRDVDWLYGDSAAQIFSSIHEGRSEGMPAWGTKLPEDQIWKLVTYVKSLRTPDEPDPPE